MHSIEFLQYKTQYPGNWNELNREQLLFISLLMAQKMEKPSFNTIVLQFFTDIPWKEFFKIPVVALTEMAKTIDFLHSKRELTINLIPELIIKGIGVRSLHATTQQATTIQGPQNQMTNATFEQFFGHTESAFSAYAKTNDMEMLDYLISSLYSFENETFNPLVVEQNQKLIKNIDTKFKIAVLLFYLGCRDLMANKFPELFKKSKTKIAASDMYYFEMVENLNNENLSNNEKVKKSNLWEAFTRLTAMIEKARKLKARK